MLGHSYRRMTMLRASEAHSSPLKKAGVVLSFGCVENRAEIAHTARISTGGSVPALWGTLETSGIWETGYAYLNFLIKLGLCNK